LDEYGIISNKASVTNRMGFSGEALRFALSRSPNETDLYRSLPTLIPFASSGTMRTLGQAH
jgi:hypothetical protein